MGSNPIPPALAIDAPRNNTLGFIDPLDPNTFGRISYNEVARWKVIWKVTGYLDLEFEISNRRTNSLLFTAANEGTLLHFASTLKFYAPSFLLRRRVACRECLNVRSTRRSTLSVISSSEEYATMDATGPPPMSHRIKREFGQIDIS